MTAIELSRRERKKDETRERISQAAIQLFREKGFETATVDEIAARADVAKGTFFNYFPRKEAVLHTLTERQLDALEALVEQLRDDPRPATEKIGLVVARACEFYAEHPALQRHAIIEMLRGPLSDAVSVDERAQAFMRTLVEEGRRRGELRADADLDRVTYTLRSVFFMTVLVWVHCPTMFDLREEMAARMRLAFEGLSARGAR